MKKHTTYIRTAIIVLAFLPLMLTLSMHAAQEATPPHSLQQEQNPGNQEQQSHQSPLAAALQQFSAPEILSQFNALLSTYHPDLIKQFLAKKPEPAADSEDDIYASGPDEDAHAQPALLIQTQQVNTQIDTSTKADDQTSVTPRITIASFIRSGLYNKCLSLYDLQQAIAAHQEQYEQRDVAYYKEHYDELESAEHYLQRYYLGPNISQEQLFTDAHFLYAQSPDLERALRKLFITNESITIKEAVLLQIALKRFKL